MTFCPEYAIVKVPKPVRGGAHMANVGKNIRILRTRKKMTQDALAEKLFVSNQTVSNYETGKTRPDIDTLVKIADIMEVDVNVLIHGMPSQENTRNAGIRSTALLAATVIFGFLLFSFSDYMNLLRQHTMRSAPYYLTLSLAFSAYYLLAGWVAMSSSSPWVLPSGSQNRLYRFDPAHRTHLRELHRHDRKRGCQSPR